MITNKKGIGTGLIILGVVLLVIAIIVVWVMSTYNGLVSNDENVNQKWGNVQTAYERRLDLIPNLVATVKQYAQYEGDTMTKVTELRASIGKASTPSEMQNIEGQMNGELSRLIAVAENYPNLKANENFLKLQDELAGTENRIKTERDLYNSAVKDYNINVRSFPTNMLAGLFGFAQKDMFQAQAGAETAPNVGNLFNN